MKKIRLLIAPMIAIFLETLPYGAVLIVAPSPTDRIQKTFPYFSLTPLGLGNPAPFLTALLTCIILLLALISIKRNRLHIAVCSVSAITAIISLLPLVFGVKWFSIIGGMITIALVFECFLAGKSAIKQ